MEKKCFPSFCPAVTGQVLRDKPERLHRPSVIGEPDDTRWNQYDTANQPRKDTLSSFPPWSLAVCDTKTACGSNMDERSRRPWEDLDKDCLANIFSRVPTPDLLMRVSFVCKAWHRASLNPKCWGRLDFRRALTGQNPPFSGLLTLAASRSQEGTTVLLMPFTGNFDESFELEDLDFIAGALKGLRVLGFGQVTQETTQLRLAEVIDAWTDIEGLSIGENQPHLAQTVAAVARSCPRFNQLLLSEMNLRPEAAAAVAEHLGPRLTYLGLANLFIHKNDLMLILRACKALRYLHIKDCTGFPNDDADIMKLGAGVQKFVYKPFKSRFDDEWEYGISTSDVYDGNSDDGYEI